jgi:nucleoid DNA-binding protein
MTKTDLIANVANDAGIKKTLAEAVLNAFMDNIEKALKAKTRSR